MSASNPEVDSLRKAVDTASNDSIRGRSLLALAERMRNIDLQEGLALVREAEKITRAIGDDWGNAKARGLLGSTYQHLGANDRAAGLLLDSRKVFLELKDTLELARIQVAIALLQSQNKDYDKALENYELARQYYASLGRKRGEAIALHNMAQIYDEKGDAARAKQIYLENLRLDTVPAIMYAATYNNLGNIFRDRNEVDSALYYYDLALSYKRPLGYKASIANTFNNIASCYIITREYGKARTFVDSARGLAMESGDIERIAENYQIQADLAHQTGNDGLAFEALKRYSELNDSVFNVERAAQISQLNAAYDAEAKEAEISLLQKNQEVTDAAADRLQLIVAALTIAFGLLAILLVFVIRRNRERNRSSRELLARKREIERQQEEIIAQNAELSRQNQRLAELNREKDGLIGIVAHDIRAPLNRSAALAELIAAVGPLNPEQKRFVEMIGKVSDEGGRLIQDLLELNAYERDDARVDRVETNVNEVLEHCANGFYSQASAKELELLVRPAPDPVYSLTDEKLLTRVLDNLISNAIKFTHPGKKVVLSVETDGKNVLLKVTDEGQGISEADRVKMFRKFQRLSARPTGGESSTGLGLSIVKTLVECLKGEVSVESEVGVGSTFTVSLPLVKAGERVKA